MPPPPSRTRSASAPSRTSTPKRARSAAATSSPANGSSRESRRSPPSTSVTFVPSEAQAWASSLPTGPPPSTTMLAGTSWALVASRLFQVRTESRPSIGGIAAPEPVATTTARSARSSCSPTTISPLAGEAALAAEQLDPPFLQPGQLDRVVPVVDHLVAAGEDRRGVEPVLAGDRDAGHAVGLGQHLGRPQQRLRRHAGVVGALAADQVALDDRHPPAGFGEAAGADLAGRSGAEDDRVEALARSWTPHSRQRTIQAQLARGRQASTWSIRARGCRSRLPEASLNPGTNQYVRTMSSPSPLS